MKAKKDNKVLNDSKLFAIRIIKLYQFLVEKKQEYILSKQVLRSGEKVTYGIVQTGDNVPGGIPVFRPVDIANGHNILNFNYSLFIKPVAPYKIFGNIRFGTH